MQRIDIVMHMYEFTTPENQTMVWLPTNEDTKTITYNIRTLISNNDIHPIAWSVSKIILNFNF